MSANSGLNKWIGNINNGQGAALGTAIPPSTIPVDTWEHLVITFNFSTGVSKTYINGVLVAEESSGISPYVNNFGTLDLSDRLFNIGRKTAPAFDPWEGSVDDIGIWNRVLTADEIEYLYNK